MRLAPDNRRPFRDQRVEAPLEDIETEGDRQLKKLLDKQLNKSISLEEHLAKKKVFTKPAVQKPLNEETTGTLSLQSYQEVESRLDYVNELRQLGLTEDEIKLKLKSEGLDRDGKPLVKRSKYGEDPYILEEKLKVIEAKIEAKKKSLEEDVKFSGAKYMSRHEMDLEKAISHDQHKAKSLSILMTDVKPENDLSDQNDPMDNIKELLKKVEKGRNKVAKGESEDSESSDDEDSMPPASCMTFKEFMKESKQKLNNKRVIDIPQSECPDCARSTVKCYYHSMRKESDAVVHDEKNDTIKAVSSQSETKNKRKKRHKRRQTNGQNGNNHQTDEIAQGEAGDKLEPIPLEVIEKYRISVEEIRLLDRFTEYSPGQPNKKLYLKNLSAKVTENDLRTMFMRYETALAIEYKLLTGRMKGQAFVTFPDIESATEALNAVNGYNFKGKPIIIEYGRNK